jgi:aspartate 1-decarboxylase
MLLEMLKAKIHRATVTGTDLNYEGSIAIDQDLLDAAGILPFEAVHVWNIATGARVFTYAISAKRGSGEICLNGAAARHAQRGDSVIIAAFCQPEEKEAASHRPRIVLVDQANRVLSLVPALGH